MKTKLAVVVLYFLCCLSVACKRPPPAPTRSIPTRSPLLYFTPLPTPPPTVTEIPHKLVDERQVGQYTIGLWAYYNVFYTDENPFVGGYGYFSIEAPGQPTIRIDDANTFPEMPAADLTGEGNPDILLGLAHSGSHCCRGTVLLDLGPEPVEVLRLWSGIYGRGNWGSGEFVDLDGDGAYEFITYDGIPVSFCSGARVKVILQYQPGEGYGPAGPDFPEMYADEISQRTGSYRRCSALELVAAYLYAGQPEQARQSFDEFYIFKGDDAESAWLELVEVVENGRFYTP